MYMNWLVGAENYAPRNSRSSCRNNGTEHVGMMDMDWKFIFMPVHSCHSYTRLTKKSASPNKIVNLRSVYTILFLILVLVLMPTPSVQYYFPEPTDILPNGIVIPPSSSPFDKKFTLQWQFGSGSDFSSIGFSTDYTTACSTTSSKERNVIKWRLTSGNVYDRIIGLFGFTDGTSLPPQLKKAMLERKSYKPIREGSWVENSNFVNTENLGNYNYYTTIGDQWQETGATITGVNDYIQVSSLNITLMDLFSGMDILYNMQVLNTDIDNLPMILNLTKIREMNSVSNNFTLSTLEINFKTNDTSFTLPNGQSMANFLRTPKDRNMSDFLENSAFYSRFNQNPSQSSYNSDIYTTRCYRDVVPPAGKITSSNELYIVAIASFHTLLKAQDWSKPIKGWDNNFRSYFIVYNLTDYFSIDTDGYLTPRNQLNNLDVHFIDKDFRYYYSMFYYNVNSVYRGMRYFRMCHILFYSTLIFAILLLSARKQPVKSRILINGSLSLIAMVYSGVGVILNAAAGDPLDYIVSSFELVFYLSVGFFYMFSAIRYFFSRNLYRTMYSLYRKEKVDDQKKMDYKEKEKKVKEETERKQKQVKHMKIFANFASWKMFSAAIGLIFTLILALSLFLVIWVGTRNSYGFSISITDVATYCKLVGLLGLVVPTSFVAVTIDVFINKNSLFKEGKLKWFFIDDDPLLFRLEFFTFIPAVFVGIALFVVDRVYALQNYTSIVYDISYYVGHGFVFLLFELCFLLFGCGGFISIIQIVQYIRLKFQKTKAISKSESEKSELEKMLEDPEFSETFERYTVREFSYENFIAFKTVIQLEKMATKEKSKQGKINDRLSLKPNSIELTVQHIASLPSFGSTTNFEPKSPTEMSTKEDSSDSDTISVISGSTITVKQKVKNFSADLNQLISDFLSQTEDLSTINLSGETKKLALEHLRLRLSPLSVSIDTGLPRPLDLKLIDELKQEILTNIKDTHYRFMLTDLYRALIEKKEVHNKLTNV